MQLSVAADHLVSIDIILGRSNGVYRPGDRLTGHVIIDAKQDIPLCGMFSLAFSILTHIDTQTVDYVRLRCMQSK